MSQDAARSPEQPEGSDPSPAAGKVPQEQTPSEQASPEQTAPAPQDTPPGPAGAPVAEGGATAAAQHASVLRQRISAVAGKFGAGSPGGGRRVAFASDRFDKFTERAKRVLVLSQEEAQRFNHNYIGTEHLLLGLVREGEGIAAKVLVGMGIELNKTRASVEFIIGRGDRKVTGDISLTPRAKKVIELAVDEARRLNHNYVGTEHLLLGLIREGEGIAAGVLESLGAHLEDARRNVLRILGDVTRAVEPMSTKENVISCRLGDADLRAIDMLVEAGIRATRSEAAQWLIHAGIVANKELFSRVEGTVTEIRRLRDEARQAAWRMAGDAEALLNTTAAEEPPPPSGKDAPQKEA